jgi:membrane protein DedA with SNARE-associated domain
MPIIGVVVPGMNVMILVGGFWGKYADHIYPTILCAISGAMLGNYIGYILGKYFGRNFINEYGEWFGIGRTEADILDGQISRNGAWFVIL